MVEIVKDTTNILLVDDDPALLQALSQMLTLRMAEVQVDTVDSAPLALSQLQNKTYDAIVSDIKLPGMDGLDLLAEVRAISPDLPVLLITGHGDQTLAIRALHQGASDYLLKPIDRDAFVASLQRAVQMYRLHQLVEAQQQVLQHHAALLEEQVEQRTQELLAANEAKDRMLQFVAHELCNPLAGIKGIAQLCARQNQRGEGEKVDHGLQSLLHALGRLEMLIHDLHDTSLIQTHRFVLERTRQNLVSLCQQTLEECVAAWPTATLQRSSGGELNAEIDAHRLSQVLWNLLTNARKYAPPTAPITVILERRDESACLSVCDGGIGIPTNQLSRIYEPFYRVPQTKGEGSSPVGLGVGLSLTKAMVEEHGGHIQVQSTPGVGSTFTVVLPLPAEQGSTAQPHGDPAFPSVIWTLTFSTASG
jgi:signal transduction histidine kinase